MAFVARWSFDVPFGRKPDVFRRMNEWERYATELGWPESRTLVGSIGTPESRVQVEYQFDKLADLEKIWAKLGDERFTKWQTELAPFVVPGSHRWEIWRVEPSP